MQRANDDDHTRRVRYNSASITVHNTSPGVNFKNIPNLKVIYITEFDYFENGLTLYTVDKRLANSYNIVDDGSEGAALMKCFLQTDVNDSRFPELSKEMKKLKCTEKGVGSMGKVIDELIEQEMKEKNTQLSKKNAQISRKNAQLKAKDQYIAELERRLRELSPT